VSAKDISPEALELIRDELERLHDLILKPPTPQVSEWAISQVTEIHKTLLCTVVWVPA